MSQIQITLNGKQVACESGQTILQVARANGVDIPTLCHDDILEPFASCWICVVEVEGARGFVPACATKVAAGMVVNTESERITAARQMCLQLLLSNHYGDCLAPCVLKCPANCDAQGYIALLANGMYDEAIKLIKQTLPLPASLGRVCPHPCEDECRRALVEEPVAICYLKRFLADSDLSSDKPYLPECLPPSGKKVAVVGSGPAGLTAAYYLRQKGHAVTIYEALPKSGGWLRYGIPQYRLPKELLDREVKTITDLGIEIRYLQRLGQEITLQDLKSEYDAVFLGLGAHASIKMGVENEDAPHVVAGIDFLKGLAMGQPIDLKKDGIRRVAVIGGGNTAIDAARTSLRLGAEEVMIVYRRTEREMPANLLEIEEAKHEGVKFQFLTAPISVIPCAPNRSGAIVCQRMELGEPDASGRRRPVPVKGSEFHIEADLIIACIGQNPDLSGLGPGHGLGISRWGTIEADPETGATADPKVFAAGDCVTGAATVVEAIGGARKAAEAMDHFLRTGRLPTRRPQYLSSKGKLSEISREELAHIVPRARARMPMLRPSERKNFAEVEHGFSEKVARAEARRCLECGCSDLQECKLKEYATSYQVIVQRFLGEVKKHPIDESHPFILRDQSKCIMCGRCVRLCLESVGAAALGFAYRGFSAIVAPAQEKPLPQTSCISCGACIDTCPVGALSERPRQHKGMNVPLKSVPSICTYCGVGCSTSIEVKGGKIIRVIGSRESPTNLGMLCFKGKFGYECLQQEGRLDTPLIRRGRKLVRTDWDRALDIINSAFGSLVERYGPEAVAVSASGRCTLEEAEGLRTWAERMGIKNFTSFSLWGSRASRLWEITGRSLGLNYEQVMGSRRILLINTDPYRSHPVFARRLRAAVGSGSELIILNEAPNSLSDIARHVLRVKKGMTAAALSLVLKALVGRSSGSDHPGYDEMKKALSRLSASTLYKCCLSSKEVTLLVNAFEEGCLTIIDERIPEGVAVSLADILLLSARPENFIVLRAKANSAGVARFCTISPESLVAGIVKGKFKAAFLLNEDPAGSLPEGQMISQVLRKLELLAVADLYSTPTVELAQFVLPTSAVSEDDGSFINSEGRLQHFKRALTPVSGRTTRQVLQALGGVTLPGNLEVGIGKPRFVPPILKSKGRGTENFAGDVLERMAWELRRREGLSA